MPPALQVAVAFVQQPRLFRFFGNGDREMVDALGDCRDAVGIELAGSYSFTDEWTLFGSYAYNDSKYDDNVVDATLPAPILTSGKTQVLADTDRTAPSVGATPPKPQQLDLDLGAKQAA